MGGTVSTVIPEKSNKIARKAEEIVNEIVGKAKTVAGAGASASPKSVLEFAMSSIKTMDEGVMHLVSQCQPNVLEANADILHAYYEATQKAQKVALEVQQHSKVCSLELKKLRALAHTYNNGDRQVAKKNLNQLDLEKMTLPQSLVEKPIKEAMNAYKTMIDLCNKPAEDLKQKREEVGRWVWTAVGVSCLIVMSVALCAVASVGATAEVSHVSTSPATATAIATSISGVVVGGAEAAQLTSQIRQLNHLADTIKEHQQHMEGILNEIKPVKDTVEKLRNKLLRIAGSKATAIDMEGEYMMDITCDDFLKFLETLLEELASLSKTCQELCTIVDKGYKFYKSGFISERVRLGKNYED